jgi:hypothetical protein
MPHAEPHDRFMELFAHEQQAQARVSLVEYQIVMEALCLARAFPDDPRFAELHRLVGQRSAAQTAHLAATRAFSSATPLMPRPEGDFDA